MNTFFHSQMEPDGVMKMCQLELRKQIGGNTMELIGKQMSFRSESGWLSFKLPNFLPCYCSTINLETMKEWMQN